MIVPNFSKNTTTQLMFFILANFHIFQHEKYDFNTEKGFFGEKKIALVHYIEKRRGGQDGGNHQISPIDSKG
jgi:hypothetical protein